MLVLTGLALILIPNLNKTENVLAFENYINLRFELRNLVKNLINNECWKNYQKEYSEGVIGTWKLHEILEKSCPLSSSGIVIPSSSKSISEPKSTASTKNKNLEINIPTTSKEIPKPDKIRPGKPTGLRIISSLPYVKELEANLRALNDQEMLRKAATVSNRLNMALLF